MPADKPNKLSQKLDGMEGIPEGFRLNREELWQRLEKRLPHRPARRSVWWYAAATLVLLTAGLLVLAPHTSTPVRAFDKNPPSSEPAVIPGATRPTKRPAITAAAQPRQVNQPSGTARSLTIMRPEKDSAFLLPPEDPGLTAAPKNSLPDTTKMAVNLKPKRQFAIAHINDLEPGTPQTSESPQFITSKRPVLTTISENLSLNEEKLVLKKKRSSTFLTSSTQ